jgi:hypothetical protein
MSPEAAAFIVLGLCVLAGAGLLMLGGWLVGYDLGRKPGARTSRLMEDLRPVEDLMVDFFCAQWSVRSTSELSRREPTAAAAHRGSAEH